MKPHARQDKLLVREVGDELVVYDQDRHQAHRLNRTAALVWRRCDGQTTVAELATLTSSLFCRLYPAHVIAYLLNRLTSTVSV